MQTKLLCHRILCVYFSLVLKYKVYENKQLSFISVEHSNNKTPPSPRHPSPQHHVIKNLQFGFRTTIVIKLLSNIGCLRIKKLLVSISNVHSLLSVCKYKILHQDLKYKLYFENKVLLLFFVHSEES